MAYLKPDSQKTWNGVTVSEYLLTKHNPNKIAMPTANLPAKPIGVTVHNTDSINVNAATTEAETYVRATVNGNMNTVRVHFYVDSVGIWQMLPLTLTSWHAADGNGNGNMKTISIECIMSSKYTDKDKKAEANCAKLVAYLLDMYGMNVEDNLYTHTHWLAVRDGKKGTKEQLNQLKGLAKWCPAYILPHWTTFENSVKSYMKKNNTVTPAQTTVPTQNTTNTYTQYLAVGTKIYKDPTTNNMTVVGTITSATKYTIVKDYTKNGTKYGYLKSGAGWVVISTETPAVTAAPPVTNATKTYKAGDVVKLDKCPLYSSSSKTTQTSTRTGTYYIYNATVTNNRIRITTKKENADKKPVGSYVTGWINIKDIK